MLGFQTMHVKDRWLGCVSLTIFCWVFLMNFMDLIPVDVPMHFLLSVLITLGLYQQQILTIHLRYPHLSFLDNF